MIIEVCKEVDKPKLLDFLKTYWKEDHILVKSPEFLEWQHGNSSKGLNFMIAKDSDDEILAIYGFIPQSHFDNDIPYKYGKNEAWGAIWKIRPDCRIPGLGVHVLRKVFAQFDFVCGIGLSDMSKKIYQSMKCEMHNMRQYYVLNPSIQDFHIAEVYSHDYTLINTYKSNIEIKDIQNVRDIKLEHKYRPIKTVTYLLNRYANHPVYNYQFIGCYSNEEIKCILVYRIITVGGRTCARIVDIYGDIDNIKGLGFKLQEYLSSKPNMEYFDIYNYGLDEDIFIKNGFKEVIYNQKNIIPNYFEPFVKKNVDLQFFYLSKEKDTRYVLFKGDSDQDRPNYFIPKH